MELIVIENTPDLTEEEREKRHQAFLRAASRILKECRGKREEEAPQIK